MKDGIRYDHIPGASQEGKLDITHEAGCIVDVLGYEQSAGMADMGS